MKILSAAQTKNVDQYTIDREPIASVDLMERAAGAFTEWFITEFAPKSSVCIICGTGNNGGDGLVIGRLLIQRGYTVNVFAIKKSDKASEDFQVNEGRLKEFGEVKVILEENDIPDVSSYDIIIDAIFGSGLDRPVEGLHARVIEAVNSNKKLTVSVDIASGLFADKHTTGESVVHADYTVSFQLPKLAFFLPENTSYVGEWHVVDIQLMPEAIDAQETDHVMLTAQMIRPQLTRRSKFSHKGTHGKALIMAGSYGKMGAAVLAARAAMRTGLGLLTMYIPACGYDIIQSTIPEAMAAIDEGDHYLTSYTEAAAYDALGIGPGLGREQETIYSVMQSIQNFGKPVVIDADGLNIISEHREMLEILPENTILTPHPKEFERLAGGWPDDFAKLEKQRAFSRDHQVIVVLKGAYTSISLPSGMIFFNSTGNPGMATGGAGDVLTGMITSLVAQGHTPENAAKVGVYLHGLAGDLASEVVGEMGMIASDIVDFIPDAHAHLL